MKIHRDLIFAFRFAASASLGNSRLVYYLGGVDNLTIHLPILLPKFDQSIPVDKIEKYAYQTLATNMRGFTQNIRNGNKFALINSEIRFPIVKYFANNPVSSNFWSTLQIVGFADIGTAWAGLTPYSGKNAYDKETIKNYPVTITIDTNREPIVAGFGLGLRFKLMGYYIRIDYARGIENRTILPRLLYLSTRIITLSERLHIKFILIFDFFI